MKKKKWLSVMTAAAMVLSVLTVPGTQVRAAEGMVTEEDLSDIAVKEPESWGAVPNEEQLWYMKQGLAAFCHFGPNTFNNIEWGENYGQTDPSEIFKLSSDFDADSMVKAVKDAGFSRMMLTAKHHDGFCLWATELTTYNISNTNYKNGEGDILEEISDACTKYNVDMGLYLSPWDIHEDKYGCFGDNNNTPNSTGITDYNELYIGSIREICTATKKDENGNTLTDENGDPVYKYGNNNPDRRSDRFVEWWMDGAQGGSNHTQTYDWTGIFEAIRETNPNCQIFGTHAAGNGLNGAADKELASTGGIHWIGNEEGLAADETWAKVNKGENYESMRKDGYIKGISGGNQWSVPECDTKMLASGWFWSASKQNSLRSMDNLANIYFNSVGHGATLLLNLSPNTDGQIDDAQMARLQEFGENIQGTFDHDFTKEEGVTASASSVWGDSRTYSPNNVLDEIPDGENYDTTYWAPAEGETTGTLEIDLGKAVVFDVVSIEEYIQKGQKISSFSVEYKGINGKWEEFGSGKTISSKRLVRNEAVTGTAVRINIESAESTPMLCNVGVFKAEEGFETEASNVVKLPTNLQSIPIREFTLDDSWIFENDDTSAWSNANKGGEASFNFTGTKAWILGTIDPNHGTMDVYIDGDKVGTANTYSSTRALGQLLYTTPDLEYGPHTVRLVCTKNAIGMSEALYQDGSGIFSIKRKNYNVLEGDQVEVEIVRTAGSRGEVEVAYSTPSAGAEQGVNYQFLDDKVTFQDGETSKKITLTTFKNERGSDGMAFYFTLMNAEGASLGTQSDSKIVIYKNELPQPEDEPYTAENPFIMPKGTAAKKAEAEFFVLDASGAENPDNYVRVDDNSQASGGKEVNWFEPGNKITLPFYAARTGKYKVTVTYRSGRVQGGTPNALVWNGTNVSSGSLDVYGESGATAYHTAEFEIEISETGDGELVFTADSKAGPVIDKFEFKCLNPVIEVEGVTLSKDSVELNEKGQTVQLQADVSPANAENKNVTFVSADQQVATVDENGVVTAVANGETTITVITEDGGKTASCKVTVSIKSEIPQELLNQLQSALTGAQGKAESEYTPESWAVFNRAYEAAKAMQNNTNASKQEIEKAIAELKNAENALIRKAADPVVNLPEVGSTFKYKNAVYKVTKSAAVQGTVTFVRPLKKTNKKFTVPATVKKDGITFEVTAVAKKAFKNNKRLTQVTIGKNIKNIGASAFEGAGKLKKITIQTSVLKKVGKKAFKGIHEKCKIKVPKKKLKDYQKRLKGKGQKSSVKIVK